MAGAFLKDLRGLNIVAMVPPNSEGKFLVEHLRRIGCQTTSVWPLPREFPPMVDIVLLAIDDEHMHGVRDLLSTLGESPPTLIAVVGYENPATLQIVLEHNFFAIIERPIRSFGLLANLAMARNLWLQHRSTVKELRNYRRRALGDQKVMRAKSILMAARGLSEEDAYRELRMQAQTGRVSIEAIADRVIQEDRHRALCRVGE